MTTTALPAGPGLAPTNQEKRDFATELRKQTVACRVRHEKLGVRKALTKDQIKTAATPFGADYSALSMAKKLIDTRDPAYRAVVNVRSRSSAYWKMTTTPYPEPGMRLIRKDGVEAFVKKMDEFRQELRSSAAALQAKYSELRENAQHQLGDLFDDADYPNRIDDVFDLDWDFPSIEPPEYLKQLHPHLYEQECERIKGRFEEAVRLTEQAFLQKFHELVVHLADRLSGGEDGKPKVFRDSAVGNLNEFFADFKKLDMGSSVEMQSLVDRAQQVIGGVAVDDLRSAEDVRKTVAEQLGEITGAIDQMMVNKPKRAIEFEEDDA